MIEHAKIDLKKQGGKSGRITIKHNHYVLERFQTIWQHHQRTFGTWRLVVWLANILPSWQRLPIIGPDYEQFYLDLRDPCCVSLLYKGFAEWAEVAVISDEIPQDGVGMDIGANTGFWSRCLLSLRPGVLIYAFEPSKSTFGLLSLNCLPFPRIKPVCIALSDEIGEAHFGTQNSSDLRYLGGGGELVNVWTLDEWILANGISRLDFVKIDVEGAEAKVVRGAIYSIGKYRPVVLFEWIPENAARFGNDNMVDILDIFHELNYSVKRVQANGSLTIDLSMEKDVTNNYLATPRMPR